MHNGKYQCHMAASCTYHRPTIISCCSTRAIQKSLTLNEKYLSFLEKKSGEWTISRKMTKQKEQEDLAEKTREEIGKRNHMTALRFQTGGRHQTSPASIQGARCLNSTKRTLFS